MVFFKNENSALETLRQLAIAEHKEERNAKIKIDGVIYYWSQEIKVAVDAALTEWLSEYLDSDYADIFDHETEPSEEVIARRQALFAQARTPPANDSFMEGYE